MSQVVQPIDTSQEAALILRIRQGDVAAFDLVFHQYVGFLRTIALRYLKDPELADDALQDVFLKLWQHRQHLDEQQSLKSFLAVAMRNQVLNTIRDEQRAIQHHTAYRYIKPEADTSTEDTVVLNDYTTLLDQALTYLTRQQRLIFKLKSQQGLTNEEVADQLKLSVNTVKVHYYQATQQLRGFLRENAGVDVLFMLILSQLHCASCTVPIHFFTFV